MHMHSRQQALHRDAFHDDAGMLRGLCGRGLAAVWLSVGGVFRERLQP